MPAEPCVLRVRANARVHRALDSLEGSPEPGFDTSEINAVANLEIHFVDSSGVISWNFMGDTPDFRVCGLELQQHHRGRLSLAGQLHSRRRPRYLRG